MIADAVASSRQGDHRAAVRLYEQALQLFREIDDRPKMLGTMSDLATQFATMGELEKGGAEQRRVISLAHEIGDRPLEAAATRALAMVLLSQGNLAGAERAENVCLQIARENGDKRTELTNLNDLEVVLEYEGKLGEAENSNKEALLISGQSEDKIVSAENRTNLAELYLSEDRPAESETFIRQALPIFQKGKAPEDEVWADAVLARALLAQGKSDEAMRVIQSAPSAGISDNETRFEFTLASARVRGFSQKPDEQQAAIESMKAMETEASGDGHIGYAFEARLVIGEIEMKSNRAAEGRRALAALEKEARGKGYALIASKAAKAAKA
jgi:tetratricopeptide (TPR) repeat protein